MSQDTSVPVAFALIKKTELVTDKKTGKDKWQSKRTKNQYAREMIAAVVHKQVPFRYVLADVWFPSTENMVFIKNKAKKEFLLPLKSNRKVALSEGHKKRGQWTTLSSLCFDTDAPLTLFLESVAFAVVVSRQVFTNDDGSQSLLSLASSDLSLSAASLWTIYQERGKVEEYHKSLGSDASFAKSPTKLAHTRSNHFFARIVAFIKLGAYRTTTRRNHFGCRGYGFGCVVPMIGVWSLSPAPTAATRKMSSSSAPTAPARHAAAVMAAAEPLRSIPRARL